MVRKICVKYEASVQRFKSYTRIYGLNNQYECVNLSEYGRKLPSLSLKHWAKVDTLSYVLKILY